MAHDLSAHFIRGEIERNATQRNAALLIALVLPSTAVADSLWPDASCHASSAYMYGSAYNRVVHVYVENDFAAELSSCTPTTNDDGKMAEDDVRQRIDEALQKWNQQAIGLSFVYEGVLNAVDGPTACNMSGVQLPAVFVNFWKGCKVVNGVCDKGGNGAWATATRHSNNCSSITVWGDRSTINACDADAMNWSLRTDSGSPVIVQSVMTHEFGHIAGLRHSNWDPTYLQDGGDRPDCTGHSCTNDALMNSAANQYVHLRSWDKDCSETFDNNLFLGRILNRRYMFNYNNTNTYGYYATAQHGYTTRRGEVFGGAMDNYYGLFDSSGYLDYDVAPNLGASVSFGNFGVVASEFLSAHVPPTFWSSYGSLSGPHRAFTQIEGYNSGVPPLEYDPPFVRESVSSDRFATTTTQYLRYQEPPDGATMAFVRSNLPVVTAYDPQSHQSIVVWVDTEHTSRTNGEIRVHAGFAVCR